MINKETIISAYDEKLTLVQWLKVVNKALDEAVLTGVEIRQKGNATFTFLFTFEDGTQVESNEIIINKGDSVASASIVDGHLILTLTNEEEIDAGNIKPVSSFSFNSERHLIVTYADGTTEDLGLIKGVSSFSFNSQRHLIVNYDNGTTEDLGLIKGVSSFTLDANKHLIVNYDNGTTEDLGAVLSGEYDLTGLDVIAKTFSQSNANWAVSGNMSKTSYISNVTLTNIYNRAEIINNVLYLIINVKLKNETENTITASANIQLLQWDIYDMPTEYASKVYDFLGKSVHDNTQSGVVDFTKITEISARAMSTPTIVTTHKSGFYMSYNNRSSRNTSVLFLQKEDAFSIAPNEELYITARIALTLI